MSCKRFVLASAAAAALILAAAGAAQAGDGSVRPSNYTFPAGLPGFRLTTHGGPANPGILVGFNPQPEPPGDFAPLGDGSVRPTFIDLTDPTRPVLFTDAPTDAFSLHFNITGHGDGRVEPPVADRSGHIEFFHTLDGHRFDITFDLGPGGIDPATWVAFNPQPDPPGIGFGVNFNFAGGGIAPTAQSVDGHAFAFSIKLDGQDLNFAMTPEPSSWAMMLTGFGMGGAALRARRRRVPSGA